MNRRNMMLSLGASFVPGVAGARDLDGRWAQSTNREWFNGLTNAKGSRCCDDGDGRRIEDPDWRKIPAAGGDRYIVKMEPNGPWVDVHPDAVVKEHNKVGYAMIWRTFDDCTGTWNIACFLPGNET